MKIFNFLVCGSIVFSGVCVLAGDQAAWTCTGKDRSLVGTKTYIGESKSAQMMTQTLYTLKRTSGADIAYFVDDENDEDNGKVGTLILTGKNRRNARYQVVMNAPKDTSDGTLTRLEALGSISYSYGPVKGERQPVACVFE